MATRDAAQIEWLLRLRQQKFCECGLIVANHRLRGRDKEDDALLAQSYRAAIPLCWSSRWVFAGDLHICPKARVYFRHHIECAKATRARTSQSSCLILQKQKERSASIHPPSRAKQTVRSGLAHSTCRVSALHGIRFRSWSPLSLQTYSGRIGFRLHLKACGPVDTSTPRTRVGTKP